MQAKCLLLPRQSRNRELGATERTGLIACIRQGRGCRRFCSVVLGLRHYFRIARDPCIAATTSSYFTCCVRNICML
jgi:hypothetical protein